jgi:WD40 repeat protein
MKHPLLFLCSIILLFALVQVPPESGASFIDGDLFVASSLTDEVRYYDSETLAFKNAFTHELFQVGGASHQYGPSGMAFNPRGNLIVAAYTHFVEFSAPGVEVYRYQKHVSESTENVVFDRLGNMYTTTGTAGSNLLNQYRASDYLYQQSIPLPPGAGELTGITLDDQDRLYVASQADGKIHVLTPNTDFSVFTFSHSIESENPMKLEGLQINQNGELIAAGGDITRYDTGTGQMIGVFDIKPDTDVFPVSVTVDNLGQIYVADFENGAGSISADIIRFAPDGSSALFINDQGLFGPFGLAIAGTKLPGNPQPTPVPGTILLLGSGMIGLFGLTKKRQKISDK